MKNINHGALKKYRYLLILCAKFLSFFKLVRPGFDVSKSKKFLFIELHLIGDLVILTALLDAVKERYPGSRIDLLAGADAIAISRFYKTQVNNVYLYDAPWVKKNYIFYKSIICLINLIVKLNKNKYDCVVDVRGDFRNTIIGYLLAPKALLGYDFMFMGQLLTHKVFDDLTPKSLVEHHYFLSKELGCHRDAKNFIPNLVSGNPGMNQSMNGVIGVHLGASMELRRPPLEVSKLIIVEVFRKYNPKKIIIFDTPDQINIISNISQLLPNEVLDLIEIQKLTLPDFVSCLSSLERFICLDSGPAHISAALGVNTVVLFGPSLPSLTRPHGKSVKLIEPMENIPCRPCDQKNCVSKQYQSCYLSYEEKSIFIT